MSVLLKLFAFLLFVVIGGFLVYTAGGYIDHMLQPGCDFFRLAAVSLFGTFVIVFGSLAGVWSLADRHDPFAPR